MSVILRPLGAEFLLTGAAGDDWAAAEGTPYFKPGAIAAAPIETWSNSLRVISDFMIRLLHSVSALHGEQRPDCQNASFLLARFVACVKPDRTVEPEEIGITSLCRMPPFNPIDPAPRYHFAVA